MYLNGYGDWCTRKTISNRKFGFGCVGKLNQRKDGFGTFLNVGQFCLKTVDWECSGAYKV